MLRPMVIVIGVCVSLGGGRVPVRREANQGEGQAPGALCGKLSRAGGKAIEKATVFAWPVGQGSGSREPSITDAQSDGTYRFDKLTPGRYAVTATDGTLGDRERWVAVLGGGFKREEGRRISLTPGGEVCGLDLESTIQALRIVRGTLKCASDDKLGPKIKVIFLKSCEDDPFPTGAIAELQAGGMFEFASVPPGCYQLQGFVPMRGLSNWATFSEDNPVFTPKWSPESLRQFLGDPPPPGQK